VVAEVEVFIHLVELVAELVPQVEVMGVNIMVTTEQVHQLTEAVVAAVVLVLQQDLVVLA
jgi:hypothetical protein